jgi:hypothetical protein
MGKKSIKAKKQKKQTLYEDIYNGGMGISVYPDFKGGISMFYLLSKTILKSLKNDKKFTR